MTHYAPPIAAFVSMLVTFVLLYSKAGQAIQDVPNDRSLHDAPIPRVGGVGLMAGILAAWGLMFRSLAWWVVLPLLLLFVVSLVDDTRGLTVRQRLLAQAVAAAILVTGSGMVTQNPLLAGVVLLAAVWMTNLYNFMDGSDGLAGGMAFFGFSAYGAVSIMSGDTTQAMLNFSIGAAALGFLYHNFHPAKVFMGDAGSIPLGFLAAAMGIWGWTLGHWPVWFPFLVFSPFVMDATVTLIKRSVRGAQVTVAHREHYYQRLVQMGWSHRNVALAGYALMAASGISSVWTARHAQVLPWVLLVWSAIYLVLMLAVDARWRAYRREQHDPA
jgi:UDP-GlcNAc:undecaprenyl-phosphate/decaprenyl-phosphate GlcNAc-1-phosphate transferase